MSEPFGTQHEKCCEGSNDYREPGAGTFLDDLRQRRGAPPLDGHHHGTKNHLIEHKQAEELM